MHVEQQPVYLFEKPLGIRKGMIKKLGVETLLTCSDAFTIYKRWQAFNWTDPFKQMKFWYMHLDTIFLNNNPKLADFRVTK